LAVIASSVAAVLDGSNCRAGQRRLVSRYAIVSAVAALAMATGWWAMKFSWFESIQLDWPNSL
jgi:hypothetical protein